MQGQFFLFMANLVIIGLLLLIILNIGRQEISDSFLPYRLNRISAGECSRPRDPVFFSFSLEYSSLAWYYIAIKT